MGFAVSGVLLVFAVIFAVQAIKASSALRLAASQTEVLKSQIVSGDDVGAKATLTALQISTRDAHETTDSLLWDVGSRVPFLGRNVSAIQTVSAVVDQVALEALPPLVGLSEKVNLNAFSPRDGKIDLKTIVEIRPSVTDAATALTAANDRVKTINAGSLLVPIREPVLTIQSKLEAAQSAAVTSSSAARLMPSMLGGKGARRYLLLVQNNAEIRPTGGIAGSFAILNANKGKLSMGQQGSIQDLLPFPDPVMPMAKDESAVFSSSLVSDLRDVNLTPNFPRTSEIAKAMAKRGLGVDVDGVISVDPIAMGYFLAGTGPITLATKGLVIDQNNAVDVLLNGIYLDYPDNQVQDDLFEEAARATFDLVKSGRGDSRLVISGLVEAANENRLTLWSSHKSEQAEISQTGLSGIVGGDDGKSPHVGIYLSDSASTKMEYYLDYTAFVRAERCLAGDIQQLTATTMLTSVAPAKAAKLSKSVTGDGAFTPRGTMRLNVRLYSPYEGGFTEVKVNGKKQTVYADRHLGRNVTRVGVTIKPGQTYTVTATMLSGRGQGADGVASTTPGIRTTRNDVPIPSACD